MRIALGMLLAFTAAAADRGNRPAHRPDAAAAGVAGEDAGGVQAGDRDSERPQSRRSAEDGEAARRPVPRRGHSRRRHPRHALRGAARRQDRGADRPLALAARDEEADADPRPHGRRRGQARGLEVRSVRVPRGGRLLPRPRHQRHEERRRRDHHGGGQADVAKGSSPTATSSSSTAATRRRRARARRSASTEWRNLTDAEFGLNADGGCASYDEKFSPLGCGISTAEKTFQTYFLTTHNPGGHSSQPRPDNAIYDLADALEEAAEPPLRRRC